MHKNIDETRAFFRDMAFGKWLQPMCSMIGLLRNNVELEECGFVIDGLQKSHLKSLDANNPFVSIQDMAAEKLMKLVLAMMSLRHASHACVCQSHVCPRIDTSC